MSSKRNIKPSIEPNYYGPNKSNITMAGTFDKASQQWCDEQGGSFLNDSGLIVRTSKTKFQAVFWGEIAWAAIEGAKRCPAMRRDLLEALRALEDDHG